MYWHMMGAGKQHRYTDTLHQYPAQGIGVVLSVLHGE